LIKEVSCYWTEEEQHWDHFRELFLLHVSPTNEQQHERVVVLLINIESFEQAVSAHLLLLIYDIIEYDL